MPPNPSFSQGPMLVVLCFMCLWLADGRGLSYSLCGLRLIHPLSLSYYVLDQ